jgi:Ca2+-binding EF-hand superfamily protein
MGNKNSITPFESYTIALNKFSKEEILHLKDVFKFMTRNNECFNLASFIDKNNQIKSIFTKSKIIPRLFSNLDIKRDGFIDFEEYVIVTALFKFGTIESKLKFLLLMYDENFKNNGQEISKSELSLLLIDAFSIFNCEKDTQYNFTEWVDDFKEIVEGLTDLIFFQVKKIILYYIYIYICLILLSY